MVVFTKITGSQREASTLLGYKISICFQEGWPLFRECADWKKQVDNWVDGGYKVIHPSPLVNPDYDK